MFAKHPIADVASVLADPARVAMLTALLDGECRPAGELARLSNLSPSAASAHLARLTESEMLTVVKEGRHRYYKITKPEVGIALEALAVINPQRRTTTLDENEASRALRFARTCYDHLAGRSAIEIADAFLHKGMLVQRRKEFEVTPGGVVYFKSLQVDVAVLKESNRCFARPCLDWTERKYHIAGALGAALLTAYIEHGWIRRSRGSRTVRFTDRGTREMREKLGITLPPCYL